MRRESTLMASCSGSAFSPSSATLPLMVTRPSWISSSALRREGTQVLETVEPEVDQELPGGAIEERLAHHLLAAGDAHHAALQECLHHARGTDAAQLLDLGAGDGLPVGDDGQRLQRRHGQLGA